MRTFKHFPEGETCILCGCEGDGECILVGIDGTQEGNNEQAKPVHLNCIHLRYNPEAGAVYQRCAE